MFDLHIITLGINKIAFESKKTDIYKLGEKMNNYSKRFLILSLIAPTALFVSCGQDVNKKTSDNSESMKSHNEKNTNINTYNKLQNTEEAIISILSKTLNRPNSSKKFKIEKTSHLKNDLNMDSLDLVELIMNIEDTFNIVVEIDEKGVSKMLTVEDVIRYVDQHAKK